ncbi:MAG TPA: acyl carrier protein [Desulfomonilia bacterium]|jgi:acyl carrier protein
MPSSSSIKETVMNFIRENFIMGRSDVVLDEKVSLIDSGVMDSTGVLELVEFLESKYSIKIEDEELVPENLETIENIIGFLKTKGVQ